MFRNWLNISAVLLALCLGGCVGTNEPTGTEDEMKNPAWVQSRIKEMDKNLIPDKPAPKK